MLLLLFFKKVPVIGHHIGKNILKVILPIPKFFSTHNPCFLALSRDTLHSLTFRIKINQKLIDIDPSFFEVKFCPGARNW